MGLQIEYDANYGGQPGKILISQVSGAGSTAFFHLYIDRYYWAQICQRDGKWVVLDQNKSLAEAEKADIVSRIEDEIALERDYNITFYSGLQQLDEEAEVGL